jgi:hypothetical protein
MSGISGFRPFSHMRNRDIEAASATSAPAIAAATATPEQLAEQQRTAAVAARPRAADRGEENCDDDDRRGRAQPEDNDTDENGKDSKKGKGKAVKKKAVEDEGEEDDEEDEADEEAKARGVAAERARVVAILGSVLPDEPMRDRAIAAIELGMSPESTARFIKAFGGGLQAQEDPRRGSSAEPPGRALYEAMALSSANVPHVGPGSPRGAAEPSAAELIIMAGKKRRGEIA